MSRVAKQPISIPSGVEVKIDGQTVSFKGPKGDFKVNLHNTVGLKQEDSNLLVECESDRHYAMAGTMRALLNNAVVGVESGFSKKLELVGVGYRAQAKGKVLNLTLGFSHPINYEIPEGIEIETPSQTEVIVSGVDKALVGQVASEIRAYRPPEPYKGKGVRYSDERIIRKEAKKK